MRLKEINLFFTDLDLTVIDENYAFKEEAINCLQKAASKNFVIIFASSKTLSEQEYFSKKLRIPIIYIVENGSEICLPQDVLENNSHKKGCRKYVLSDISISYIHKILFTLSKKHKNLKFYENSTLKEIEYFTGLPEYLAKLAKNRLYTETIFSGFTPAIEEHLKTQSLSIQKGSRFITIGGHTDKGKAAQKLISIISNMGYRLKRIIGVGDGMNDIPLLKTVNEPYIVGNKIHLTGAMRINSLREIRL